VGQVSLFAEFGRKDHDNTENKGHFEAKYAKKQLLQVRKNDII